MVFEFLFFSSDGQCVVEVVKSPILTGQALHKPVARALRPKYSLATSGATFPASAEQSSSHHHQELFDLLTPIYRASVESEYSMWRDT